MTTKVHYKCKRHHVHKDDVSKGVFKRVTSAAFSKHLHLLVTGFDDGSFFLHEMPDFNLIHSLRLDL